MCNLIGFQATGQSVISFEDISVGYDDTTFPPCRSGFDYDTWSVIFQTEGSPQLGTMHWEFIPSWIADQRQLEEARKQGIPWFNATQEKLLDSQMFRDAAHHRRCIVPVSYFVEWMHHPGPGKRKKISIPHAIFPTTSKHFLLAGIWQAWTDRSTGETIDTFAIVTTAANPLMQRIHNSKERMPLVLTPALAAAWIMPQSGASLVDMLHYQCPDDAMHAYPIAKDFRQQPNPLAPVEYAALNSGTQGSLFE